jgi:hypothetical protein
MRRKDVDDRRFDALAQRVASIRLTRGDALRGMAASALTLAGLAQVASAQVTDERHRPGHRRPVRYCRCDNATETCTNETGTRKQRNQHVRNNPCSYKGRCKGSGTHNPCEDAGTTITVINTTLLRADCSTDPGVCGNSATSGLTCIAGICLPLLGEVCAVDGDCSAGECAGGACVCSLISICESESSDAVQCCVAEAECIGGFCVLPTSSL